jgi:tetratricopeptide (TPR) repeat protein
MTVRALLGASFALLVATACASPPRLALTPEELRAELRRRIHDLDPADEIVPFEVGPEAVALAREKLVAVPESAERARALADLLRSSEGFGLRYEWATTDTAAGTLLRGGGNCMSLSSVLIGLARDLGLDAYYLEVLVDDPTRRADADLAVYADHVAAVILTREGRLFVDYSGELPHARAVRTIGDLEAVSYYYNNRGYELLHRAHQAGGAVPWPRVAREFELATRVHPGMARAWNNLGVARARQGDDEQARQAYERAIALAPGLRSAHVNYAMLLARSGDAAGAARHLELARRLAAGSAPGELPSEPVPSTPPREEAPSG